MEWNYYSPNIISCISHHTIHITTALEYSRYKCIYAHVLQIGNWKAFAPVIKIARNQWKSSGKSLFIQKLFTNNLFLWIWHRASILCMKERHRSGVPCVYTEYEMASVASPSRVKWVGEFKKLLNAIEGAAIKI